MACEDIKAKLASLKQEKAQTAADLKDFGLEINPHSKANLVQKLAQTQKAIVAAEKELQDCLNPPPPTKAQPEHILGITFNNPSFDTSDPNWASKLVGGKTFPQDTDYEWVQVLNPSQKYPEGDLDLDIVGISGWAIHPELSDVDLWFAHPFGFDWEFYVAPDPQYASLLAPSNKVSNDFSYNRARQDAVSLALSVPGVLGVETDRGLVPEPYRAQEGDRVAVFGRWIVDAGHDDFHTEIHPPLLLITARVAPAASVPGHPHFGVIGMTGPSSVTETRIISRPYLVGQQYEGDDRVFHSHMIAEIAKVESVFLSNQLEAHPKITPKPFAGLHLIAYTVKPSTAPQTVLERLRVTFHFTVRTGVTVQVTGDSNSVTVRIAMNDITYVHASLPPKHDLKVSLEELSHANQKADTAVDWANFINVIVNPIALIVENVGGVLTDIYDPPQASSVHDSEITKVWVSDLPGNTPVSVDDSQPFPIYGFLNVQWERSEPQVIVTG